MFARRGEPVFDCQTLLTVKVIRVRQMIETIAAVMGLSCVAIFVAFAVEAYLTR